MGESELIHVLGKAGRDLAISKRTVVLFGDAHPRAEVNFVDGHGRVQRVGGGTFFEESSVIPGVVEIPDHGRDRKSTRLNSSHPSISYAVFCLKKKKKPNNNKSHKKKKKKTKQLTK